MGEGETLSALRRVGYRNELSRFHLALVLTLIFIKHRWIGKANLLQPVERQRWGHRAGTAVPGGAVSG